MIGSEEYSNLEKKILDKLKTAAPCDLATKGDHLYFIILTIASFYFPDGEYDKSEKSIYQTLELAIYFYWCSERLLYNRVSTEERKKLRGSFFWSFYSEINVANSTPNMFVQMDPVPYDKIFKSRLNSYSNIYHKNSDFQKRRNILLEFQKNLIKDILETGTFGEREYLLNSSFSDYQPIHLGGIEAFEIKTKLSDYRAIALPLLKSELWKIFPDSNNIIHKKYTDGTEEWYDEKGNIVHEKYPDGDEVWLDDKDNIIHTKTSDGEEIWIDYDAEGNKTHIRSASGVECWYDKKGNVIKKLP